MDLLTEHTVAAMLAGLSTRRYAAALEPVGAEVAAASLATSHSAASRRFVTATAERLAAFRAADLSDRDWLICRPRRHPAPPLRRRPRPPGPATATPSVAPTRTLALGRAMDNALGSSDSTTTRSLTALHRNT